MLIKGIWWRKITANDLYNIEKPLPPGPKGQLHIDIPNVQALHSFFDINHSRDPNSWPIIERNVSSLKSPDIVSKLIFRPRPKNNRYDIRLQNINSDSSERHAAWTSAFGWPSVHGLITTRDEAEEILEKESIHIVLFQSSKNEIFADFVLDLKTPKSWPIEIVTNLAKGESAGFIRFEVPYDLDESLVEPADQKTHAQVKTKKRVRAVVDRRRNKRTNVFEASELDDIKIPQIPRERVVGRGLSAAEKSVIEEYAIKESIKFLESQGFENIKDVGKIASYDLVFVKDGQVHIGEVKGTTLSGEQVNLTRNEVQVHQSHYPHNLLLIISEIELERGPSPKASGGEISFFYPWKINPTLLTVINYQYQVPVDEAECTTVNREQS